MLAAEGDGSEHHGALRPGAVRAVLLDVQDLAVRDRPDVEVHGFFGLAFEHEEGGDGVLHGVLRG